MMSWSRSDVLSLLSLLTTVVTAMAATAIAYVVAKPRIRIDCSIVYPYITLRLKNNGGSPVKLVDICRKGTQLSLRATPGGWMPTICHNTFFQCLEDKEGYDVLVAGGKDIKVENPLVGRWLAAQDSLILISSDVGGQGFEQLKDIFGVRGPLRHTVFTVRYRVVFGWMTKQECKMW